MSCTFLQPTEIQWMYYWQKEQQLPGIAKIHM